MPFEDEVGYNPQDPKEAKSSLYETREIGSRHIFGIGWLWKKIREGYNSQGPQGIPPSAEGVKMPRVDNMGEDRDRVFGDNSVEDLIDQIGEERFRDALDDGGGLDFDGDGDSGD